MRKRLVWKTLFILYLAAVAYLCFGRFETLPQVRETLFGIQMDKLVHFCMFFPLPILLYLSFRWSTGKVWKSLLLAVLLTAVGLAVGIGTEYIQGLTGYRNQDMLDFKADAISVILSSAIVLSIELFKDLRHER